MGALGPVLPEEFVPVDTVSVPVVVIVVKVAYPVEVVRESVAGVVRWSHWLVPIATALGILGVGVAVAAVVLFGKSF